ncbi:MAG: regulatory protein RecX [Melioribacteraceae bacterium]|nr:regulatory protein RecX [Melioribacteraceae bacterium]
MKIISLEKKRRNVIITFESGDSIAVRYEIFVKGMIIKGDDLSEKKIESLRNDNELFLIKESAINILSRRQHAKSELKRKLVKKGYESSVIEEVLNYLTEKKYLNDKDFAEKYAKELIRVKKYGLNKVRNALMTKGISRSIIDEIVLKLSNSDAHLENAISLAGKKLKQLSHKELEPFKLRQKISIFLQGRGYSFELINQAIQNIELNSQDEEQDDEESLFLDLE